MTMHIDNVLVKDINEDSAFGVRIYCTYLQDIKSSFRFRLTFWVLNQAASIPTPLANFQCTDLTCSSRPRHGSLWLCMDETSNRAPSVRKPHEVASDPSRHKQAALELSGRQCVESASGTFRAAVDGGSGAFTAHFQYKLFPFETGSAFLSTRRRKELQTSFSSSRNSFIWHFTLN
ncbi:hypothetical protein CEXT_648911 [Caerostris extrusa]|uniref:Uncharacterized protein n=1 Tax=Caerostris extrusa TaxID=172846 RepID=A0AAV4WD42_CAEEX|nr:hypothetical protein CEXT_648911 [Caerostris extrusa]